MTLIILTKAETRYICQKNYAEPVFIQVGYMRSGMTIDGDLFSLFFCGFQ